jgi:hypothetical protein
VKFRTKIAVFLIAMMISLVSFELIATAISVENIMLGARPVIEVFTT